MTPDDETTDGEWFWARRHHPDGWPPRRAEFADPDVCRLVSQTGPDSTVLGLATPDVAVTNNWVLESRHLLAAVNRRAAQTLATSLAAQHLRGGGEVVTAFGPSWRPMPWLDGLDAVDKWADTERIADGLAALAERVEARIGAPDATDARPRCLVLYDDGLIPRLERQHWGGRRQVRIAHRARRTSPALHALTTLLVSGAAAGVHLVQFIPETGAGAMFIPERRAGAMGGSLVPDSFETRVLGRVGKRAWRRLGIWTLPPPPWSPRGNRTHVATGRTAVATQLIEMSDRQARSWATGEP